MRLVKTKVSLASVVQAAVLQEYASETEPLNLVAITDGAKNIRYRLFSIFGSTVVLILDWYHLCKKLRLLMSMIATNQADKKIHLKFLFAQRLAWEREYCFRVPQAPGNS